MLAKIKKYYSNINNIEAKRSFTLLLLDIVKIKNKANGMEKQALDNLIKVLNDIGEENKIFYGKIEKIFNKYFIVEIRDDEEEFNNEEEMIRINTIKDNIYYRTQYDKIFGVIIAYLNKSEESDYSEYMNEELKFYIEQHEQKIQILAKKIIELIKKMRNEEKKERKRKRKEIKKEIEKRRKDEKENAKKQAKKYLEKQKNRKNNLFCKNDIEYITQEDIEDIPTEDLIYIKLENSIFCLDKDSFKNMIKYAKDQKVRGECKNNNDYRVDCKFFYPINIGQNIYIDEENYKKIKKIIKSNNYKKYILKSPRKVDFTTGLHIIGEKTGIDDVYKLETEDYEIIREKKEMKKIVKKIRKLKISDLKKICKEKGIKGYSKLKKKQLEKKCLGDDVEIIQNKTVKELKKICKEKGIKGYSKLKKKELEKKCL